MPFTLARPRTRSLVSACLAVATVLLVGGTVALAATRAVAISDFAFSPKTITITVRDRVTWTNSDAVAHTATDTGGAFDTGNIGQGESASVRFTQPGTYRYVCTPHPTMTGTIRVRAASAGPTIPPTDVAVPSAAADARIATAPWIALAAVGLLLLAFTTRLPRRGRSD